MTAQPFGIPVEKVAANSKVLGTPYVFFVIVDEYSLICRYSAEGAEVGENFTRGLNASADSRENALIKF